MICVTRESGRDPGAVWARAPRGESGGLGLDRLAEACLQILDADGIRALTMRRLASDLGLATTSSLYWRVAGKDELLDLAADAVAAQIAADAPAEGAPRERLAQVCRATYATLCARPWAAQIVATHTGFGPGYRALTACVLSLLRQAGVSDDDLAGSAATLFNYVVGAAVTGTGWRAATTARGATAQAWAQSFSDSEQDARWARAGVAAGPDDVFETGLVLILRAVT